MTIEHKEVTLMVRGKARKAHILSNTPNPLIETNIKIGYSEPTLTENILSDTSKVYGVSIKGDYDIEISCRDKQTAKNLINVWDHSVVGIVISR